MSFTYKAFSSWCVCMLVMLLIDAHNAKLYAQNIATHNMHDLSKNYLEKCGANPNVLSSIYFAPNSIEEAVNNNVNSDSLLIPSLLFHIESYPSCLKNTCILSVLRDEGRTLTARVSLRKEGLSFCQSKLVRSIDTPTEGPCSNKLYEVITTVSFRGDGEIVRTHGVIIKYRYYTGSQRVALDRRCNYQFYGDGPFRSANWVFRDQNQATIDITEEDTPSSGAGQRLYSAPLVVKIPK